MRFLIVDDHPIMRLGVKQLIHSHWPDAQIDEASTSAEALRLGQAELPSAIVLDLSLPDATGTEGASRILRAIKNVPVLVLSLNAESAYAARLLQMGVSGYLPKDKATDELVQALQRLLAGGRCRGRECLINGTAGKLRSSTESTATRHRVVDCCGADSSSTKHGAGELSPCKRLRPVDHARRGCDVLRARELADQDCG